jgi:hypothetical protein
MVIDEEKIITISVNDREIYSYLTKGLIEVAIGRSIDMRLKEIGSMAAVASPGSYKLDYVLVDKL